jgi:hypothetical protein
MIAGVAISGVFLAIVREAPLILFLIGPLIGSLWDMKKGGKGLTGGSIGGAISWGGFGLTSLITVAFQHPVDIRDFDFGLWTIVLLFITACGSIVGMALGVAVWCLSYLVTLVIKKY